MRGELEAVRWVACRLQLTGRSAIHRDLPALGRRIVSDLQMPLDPAVYFFEKIDFDAARPDLSLDELARSADPVGLLARRLLALERREPAALCESLLRQGREAIERERRSPGYVLLDDSRDPIDDEYVRDTLLGAGFAMLDEFVAQKTEEAAA